MLDETVGSSPGPSSRLRDVVDSGHESEDADMLPPVILDEHIITMLEESDQELDPDDVADLTSLVPHYSVNYRPSDAALLCTLFPAETEEQILPPNDDKRSSVRALFASAVTHHREKPSRTAVVRIDCQSVRLCLVSCAKLPILTASLFAVHVTKLSAWSPDRSELLAEAADVALFYGLARPLTPGNHSLEPSDNVSADIFETSQNNVMHEILNMSQNEPDRHARRQLTSQNNLMHEILNMSQNESERHARRELNSSQGGRGISCCVLWSKICSCFKSVSSSESLSNLPSTSRETRFRFVPEMPAASSTVPESIAEHQTALPSQRIRKEGERTVYDQVARLSKKCSPSPSRRLCDRLSVSVGILNQTTFQVDGKGGFVVEQKSQLHEDRSGGTIAADLSVALPPTLNINAEKQLADITYVRVQGAEHLKLVLSKMRYSRMLRWWFLSMLMTESIWVNSASKADAFLPSKVKRKEASGLLLDDAMPAWYFDVIGGAVCSIRLDVYFKPYSTSNTARKVESIDEYGSLRIGENEARLLDVDKKELCHWDLNNLEVGIRA